MGKEADGRGNQHKGEAGSAERSREKQRRHGCFYKLLVKVNLVNPSHLSLLPPLHFYIACPKNLWEHYLCLSKADYSLVSETVAVTVQVYLEKWFTTLPISLAEQQTSSFFRYLLFYSDSIYANRNSVEFTPTQKYA